MTLCHPVGPFYRESVGLFYSIYTSLLVCVLCMSAVTTFYFNGLRRSLLTGVSWSFVLDINGSEYSIIRLFWHMCLYWTLMGLYYSIKYVSFATSVLPPCRRFEFQGSQHVLLGRKSVGLYYRIYTSLLKHVFALQVRGTVLQSIYVSFATYVSPPCRR